MAVSHCPASTTILKKESFKTRMENAMRDANNRYGYSVELQNREQKT